MLNDQSAYRIIAENRSSQELDVAGWSPVDSPELNKLWQSLGVSSAGFGTRVKQCVLLCL